MSTEKDDNRPVHLNTTEAAELLGVSRWTLKRWRERGLPYWVTPGGSIRYDRRKIEAYIAGRGRARP